MTSAEDKCLAAGTSAETMEKVKSSVFFVQCLERGARQGKYEKEMVQDIADACEINDLDAFCLGNGTLMCSEGVQVLCL
jgi:glutamate racemase